jgi:hypothetical protein
MPLSYPSEGFKDETTFNKWLRSRIRGRGFQCLHIREADVPGPLDLLAWKPGHMVWIELKLDDREVEPSQIEFLRTQRRKGVRACVVRYWNDTERFQVEQMDRDGKLGAIYSTNDESHLLDVIL